MILSLMNQKGGVGKTSTCYHLAGAFSQRGLKVLLVDNDPQASLTQGFLGPEATRDLAPEATLAAIYAGRDPLPRDVLIALDLPGVELIPSGTPLNTFNVPDPFVLPVEQQAALAEWLRSTAGHDVVLIDCPPNLNLCSWSSLLSADGLIVPVQPEDFGAQGLGPIRSFGHDIRTRGGNPDLRMLGYLITMMDRLAVHKQFDATLRETYGDLVFANPMPRRAAFTQALAHRRPVTQYEPKGDAARSMELIAGEILDRFAATASGGGAL